MTVRDFKCPYSTVYQTNIKKTNTVIIKLDTSALIMSEFAAYSKCIVAEL